MEESCGKLSDIEKKILLSLLAIEKVTTLKIHKILKDLGCIEKFSELTLEGFRVYFGDNAEEVYEKFSNNMKFDFVSYFDFYNVKCIFCDDVYYPQDFFIEETKIYYYLKEKCQLWAVEIILHIQILR